MSEFVKSHARPETLGSEGIATILEVSMSTDCHLLCM
jgi:hypothetical protein